MIIHGMSAESVRAEMIKHGLIFFSPDPEGLISGGIQMDLCVVKGERGLCGHSCNTKRGGGYDCPDDFDAVGKVKPVYASGEEVLKDTVTFLAPDIGVFCYA